MEELLGCKEEILKVLKFVAEPSHQNTLKSIIQILERDTPSRLAFSLAMAYEILKLLKGAALTNEEIAAKIGKSAESVKQTISALKAGGINFQETSTGKFQVTGRPRKIRKIGV